PRLSRLGFLCGDQRRETGQQIREGARRARPRGQLSRPPTRLSAAFPNRPTLRGHKTCFGHHTARFCKVKYTCGRWGNRRGSAAKTAQKSLSFSLRILVDSVR